MKNILISIILLGFTFDCVSDCLKDKYYYTSIQNGVEYLKNQKIIQLNPTIDSVFVDIVNEKAGKITAMTNYLICDDNVNYYCFDSGLFRLSIPKVNGNWPKKWSVHSAQYEYLGTDSLSIFGETYDVEVVISTTHDSVSNVTTNPEIYYYSKKYGLMAFTLIYEDLDLDVNYFASQETGVRLDLIEQKTRMEKENKEEKEYTSTFLFCVEDVDLVTHTNK